MHIHRSGSLSQQCPADIETRGWIVLKWTVSPHNNTLCSCSLPTRQWPKVSDFVSRACLQFLHVHVFSDSRNVQKCVTQIIYLGPVQGHCLLPTTFLKAPAATLAAQSCQLAWPSEAFQHQMLEAGFATAGTSWVWFQVCWIHIMEFALQKPSNGAPSIEIEGCSRI